MEKEKSKISQLLKKVLNKEVIMYIIFGVLTTLVNLIVSFVLEGIAHIDGAIASAIGIVCSVLFAYFTNRKWVLSLPGGGVASRSARSAVSPYGDGAVWRVCVYC